MSVRLSVLAASGVGLAECADPNLVPVLDPDLHEQQRMAGAANGPRRDSLSATRQLFPLGGGLGTGAAVDGNAVAGQLAGITGRTGGPAQPDSQRNLPAFSFAIILVHLSERVGHRYRILQGRGFTAALPAVCASCH